MGVKSKSRFWYIPRGWKWRSGQKEALGRLRRYSQWEFHGRTKGKGQLLVRGMHIRKSELKGIKKGSRWKYNHLESFTEDEVTASKFAGELWYWDDFAEVPFDEYVPVILKCKAQAKDVAMGYKGGWVPRRFHSEREYFLGAWRDARVVSAEWDRREGAFVVWIEPGKIAKSAVVEVDVPYWQTLVVSVAGAKRLLTAAKRNPDLLPKGELGQLEEYLERREKQ
jgi:hypothetical protein